MARDSTTIESFVARRMLGSLRPWIGSRASYPSRPAKTPGVWVRVPLPVDLSHLRGVEHARQIDAVRRRDLCEGAEDRSGGEDGRGDPDPGRRSTEGGGDPVRDAAFAPRRKPRLHARTV